MYAAYETAMTVKEAVKTGAWKAGNAIKNILVSAATSLISAMSPVGSIGALLLVLLDSQQPDDLLRITLPASI